jgi:hypothetical protein
MLTKKIRIRKTSTGLWYVSCPVCRQAHEVDGWEAVLDLVNLHVARHRTTHQYFRDLYAD